MEDATKNQIEAAIRERLGPFTELEFSTVSATIGTEVVQRALQTIGLATLGIMLFLWFAFRQVPHSIRYGVAAILGMLHDVLVMTGFAAIFGYVVWLAGRFAVPDGRAHHDRLLGAGQDRGVRPHPRESGAPPGRVVRAHRQHQPAADGVPLAGDAVDYVLHHAGAGAVRRRDHSEFRRHSAGRPPQRHLLVASSSRRRFWLCGKIASGARGSGASRSRRKPPRDKATTPESRSIRSALFVFRQSG